MEEWKTIEGFPNYKVSNYGNILNVKTNRLLKGRIDKYGYYNVILYNKGKYKNYKVHQLVAIHFIDNPNKYNQINHIDEDKLNNVYSNLEWCTCKYNNNFGNRNRNISKSKMNKNCISITRYNLETKEIIIYPSLREIERLLGISHSTISKYCKSGKVFLNSIWNFNV